MKSLGRILSDAFSHVVSGRKKDNSARSFFDVDPDGDVIMTDGICDVILAETKDQVEEHYWLRKQVLSVENCYLDGNGKRYEEKPDEHDENGNALQFLVKHKKSGIIVGGIRIIMTGDSRDLPGIKSSGQYDVLPEGNNKIGIEISRVGVSKERMKEAGVKGYSPLGLMYHTPIALSGLMELEKGYYDMLPYIGLEEEGALPKMEVFMISTAEKRLTKRLRDVWNFDPVKEGRTFQLYGQRAPNCYDLAEIKDRLKDTHPEIYEKIQGIIENKTKEIDLGELAEESEVLKNVYMGMPNVRVTKEACMEYNFTEDQWYANYGDGRGYVKHPPPDDCDYAALDQMRNWYEICGR